MAIYPNVPIAPGVPPLLRNPLAPAVATALLVADLVLTLASLFQNRWGIFLDGVPVLTPDSVESFDFRDSSKVSNYPLEQGAFESYDKVQNPYEATVRMMVGGSIADRADFLATIQAVKQSLDLYDVVTPEITYLNANVDRYEYDRKAHTGLGLLVVDIHLIEVRVSATAQFTNTQAPSGAATQNSGQATPATPTPAQQATTPLVQ